MASPVYFETSVFIEIGAKRSQLKNPIRELLKAFSEDKVRVYTSIITVQELSVAVFQRGASARDTYGDISKMARIYTVTKEVALTAAKFEAALKDITKTELSKRDPKKPETEDEKLERICEKSSPKMGLLPSCNCADIGVRILIQHRQGPSEETSATRADDAGPWARCADCIH